MKLPLRRSLPCLLVVLSSLLLPGCASLAPPEAPRTTVILLPDADGQVGMVTVSTEAGTQRLDEAFTASSVDATLRAPSPARGLDREQVAADYAELLAAQPPTPTSFTLHFQLDKTALTEQSRTELPALLAALRSRKPAEVLLFGHADAPGTEERNHRLSAERARFVADLLKKHAPALQRIDIHAFGDALPLVPSQPGAPEPRNRRVEILLF